MSITAILNKFDFNGNPITIFVDIENPYFKAVDIGNVLKIVKIRKTINKFDEKVKFMTNFLTEQGLYRVLFISNVP